MRRSSQLLCRLPPEEEKPGTSHVLAAKRPAYVEKWSRTADYRRSAYKEILYHVFMAMGLLESGP